MCSRECNAFGIQEREVEWEKMAGQHMLPLQPRIFPEIMERIALVHVLALSMLSWEARSHLQARFCLQASSWSPLLYLLEQY